MEVTIKNVRKPGERDGKVVFVVKDCTDSEADLLTIAFRDTYYVPKGIQEICGGVNAAMICMESDFKEVAEALREEKE